MKVQVPPSAQGGQIVSGFEKKPGLGDTGSVAKPYSRLARVEEKKNKRGAFIYIILTIIIIIGLVAFGIPAIIKLAAFLGEINKSAVPVEVGDETPPAPPQLFNVPEYTNRKTLELRGASEEGATVVISHNGIQEEIVADSLGDFTITLSLKDGSNEITAMAKDTNGNESQKTVIYEVVYDNTPPELSFLTPEDGAQFYGSKQQDIVIEGTTEIGANLTINDRFVSVDEDGKFKYTATLNEGDNNFEAKSTDKAGNTTTDGITVHYWF